MLRTLVDFVIKKCLRLGSFNWVILRNLDLQKVRKYYGKDFLSPVQQFALDGYNDKLIKDLSLNSGSTVIVLGGYLGDSVAKYREKYDSTVYSTEPILEYFSVMQQRFCDDMSVFLFNEATAEKTSEIELFVSGEKTGFFEITGESRLVKCRDITELIDEAGRWIDHLEINIEGGEYVVLQRLIDSTYINNCNSILVQFHNYGLRQEFDRAQLRIKLSETHRIVYC
jgi:FkbM family methyltransferase